MHMVSCHSHKHYLHTHTGGPADSSSSAIIVVSIVSCVVVVLLLWLCWLLFRRDVEDEDGAAEEGISSRRPRSVLGGFSTRGSGAGLSATSQSESEVDPYKAQLSFYNGVDGGPPSTPS